MSNVQNFWVIFINIDDLNSSSLNLLMQNQVCVYRVYSHED